MQVLFLDIDGVINSSSSEIRTRRLGLLKGIDDAVIRRQKELCPIAVSNLIYLLEQLPDLQIVLSTSIRKQYKFNEIKFEMLVPNGIPAERIFDTTPLDVQDRYEAIQAYLNDPPVDISQYVILDDYHIPDPRWVPIDPRVGLTYPQVTDVVLMFQPDWKEPQLEVL